MSRRSTKRRVGLAALLAGLLFAPTLSICAAQPVEQSYQALLISMQARQPQLESELATCLGERLDGLVEIRGNCSPEARDLAEAENRDREALHELMARDLVVGADEIGRQRAERYVDRYLPGVFRQVRISDRETTWWDGRPPDPRKTSIRRVLALDGVRIYERPDSSSAVVRDYVRQYEAFGVVDSATDDAGQRWYQITEDYVPKVKPPSWSPKILGWISEQDSIPWRRALAMRFTAPLHRERAVFFRDPEPLLALMGETTEQRRKRLQDLIASAERGIAGDAIAIEPRVSSTQERAVMYPVLDFFGRGTGADLSIDGEAARVLDVAARTRASAGDSVGGGRLGPVDIMMVMDTTESMGPYIADVLAAVQDFAAASSDGDLGLGFVAYRDKDPRFGYEVREMTDAMKPPGEFARTLSGVHAQQAPVAGDDIPESVLEGVDLALRSKQWRPGAFKAIFLIGDAPGREGAHSIEELRRRADASKVKILTFHIKNSRVSKALDRTTERQYRDLSKTYQDGYGQGPETSYFHSIDSESISFRQLLHEQLRMAKAEIDRINQCASEGTLDRCGQDVESGSLAELIFQHALLVLADASMPEKEISGWVADKALDNPGRAALAPMVLFTESELEELVARVRELQQVGEMAIRGEGGTSLDFFDLVARNTRITMVDPKAVDFRDAFAVPLGIDELPYDSDIMSLTRDEFQNPDRVQRFVRSMEAKLAAYQDLLDHRGDPGVWKLLSTGARERVVGVELNHLP